jgi:asparagine synthase (glutamine-hydrolysing)
MCGIAGLFAPDRREIVLPEQAAAMANALAHRGPDGQGVRAGPGYALGHRRLAIIDVAGGDQPMADATGRLWIVFNGEIYNHAALRRELETAGCSFRTRSDTEVLLYGWRVWGENLPARLRGMFAFALIDEERHLLFAARDHVGKKPFYWTEQDGRFVFASEPKALWRVPGIGPRLDPAAIVQFLCLRYVPDPATAFTGVHRLPAGHWLRVDAGRVQVARYWRPEFRRAAGRSPQDLGAELLAKFDEAVRLRLVGERPLGAFLSGGVDSSAVVDSMARAQQGAVVACAVGFPDRAFDERPHARRAAARAGAVLHEGEVGAEDMLALDWYAETFDEPFADSSAIPTLHVSRIARQHVVVALSGDGGDESFGGYRRYAFDRLENRLRPWLPGMLWRGLGRAYPKFDYLPRWLRLRRTLGDLGVDPALAYARSVSAVLPEELFPVLTPRLRQAAGEPFAPLLAAYRDAPADDPLGRAVATDFATWLPGDILPKVDRASMAVSLEVRAPLLDREVVELAATIPPDWHFARGTKSFLRGVLEPRLGPDVWRRKQGFSVPLQRWLRGPLGDALARPDCAARLADWIDPARLQQRLAEHRAGRRDWSDLLWGVLVLDRFAERWGAT